MLNRDHCKICLLASYIGLLIFICPAVQYGTPRFWRGKSPALPFLALTVVDNDFEAQTSLPASIREDLL